MVFWAPEPGQLDFRPLAEGGEVLAAQLVAAGRAVGAGIERGAENERQEQGRKELDSVAKLLESSGSRQEYKYRPIDQPANRDVLDSYESLTPFIGEDGAFKATVEHLIRTRGYDPSTASAKLGDALRERTIEYLNPVAERKIAAGIARVAASGLPTDSISQALEITSRGMAKSGSQAMEMANAESAALLGVEQQMTERDKLAKQFEYSSALNRQEGEVRTGLQTQAIEAQKQESAADRAAREKLQTEELGQRGRLESLRLGLDRARLNVERHLGEQRASMDERQLQEQIRSHMEDADLRRDELGIMAERAKGSGVSDAQAAQRLSAMETMNHVAYNPDEIASTGFVTANPDEGAVFLGKKDLLLANLRNAGWSGVTEQDLSRIKLSLDENGAPVVFVTAGAEGQGQLDQDPRRNEAARRVLLTGKADELADYIALSIARGQSLQRTSESLQGDRKGFLPEEMRDLRRFIGTIVSAKAQRPAQQLAPPSQAGGVRTFQQTVDDAMSTDYDVKQE